MTEDQIKDAIRSGLPFLAISPHGQFLARYMPFGPVFRWQKNRMLPMPLQGDDLCWWLQAADEDEDEKPGNADR